MNANHDHSLDLVAALVLGSIEPDDFRALEAHRSAGCAECDAFERSLSSPIETLARSVEPVRPPKGLKARVMVQVAQGGPARGKAREARGTAPAAARAPAWAWGTAAVAAVVAALGWWRAATLGDRVDVLEAEVARREPRLAPEVELARFVEAHPTARTLVLEPTPDGEKGPTARVAYDATARRALVAVEGFRPPAGQAFELWTVRGGKTVSEGVLRVDAEGRGLMTVENTGDPAVLEAFAISSEEAGGAKDRQTPRKVVNLAPLS